MFQRQRLARVARSNPDLKPKFDELQGVAAQLASVYLSHDNSSRAESRTGQFTALSERREQLESELAKSSDQFASFRNQTRITADDIGNSLPDNVALIDLISHQQFSVSAAGRLQASPALTAFVVRRDQPVLRISLPEAHRHVELIGTWRQHYGQGESGERAGRALRALLWEPLTAALDGVSTVLISPDGVTAQFPFAALPGRRPETWLIEDVAIVSIPVPQMLPSILRREANNQAEKQTILLAGDIDFETTVSKPATKGVAPQAANRSGSQSRSFDFSPLPGTAREIQAIERLFNTSGVPGRIVTMRESDATEQRFRELCAGSQLIHLATHGYFEQESGSLSQQQSVALDLWEVGASLQSRMQQRHPGLSCGLALAGANQGDETAKQSVVSPTSDGILSALEVAALDFSSTELAVLSACETGLGHLQVGEGVLGLQRAMQVAGARSTVTSLWKVDDHATQLLMVRFYDNLWNGKLGPLKSLREAQLAMLHYYSAQTDHLPRGASLDPLGRKERAASPRFWASFVLSGDWR